MGESLGGHFGKAWATTAGHSSQEQVKFCAADGIHTETFVLPKQLFQIQISSVYF